MSKTIQTVSFKVNTHCIDYVDTMCIMRSSGERLAYAIKLAGYKKRADFAEVVGIEAGTLRQQINRDSVPLEAAELYARKLRRIGVTTDWLLFNKGPAPGQSHDSAAVHGKTAERTLQLPVSTIVSAGDEIVDPVDGDEPFDREDAPPGMPEGEVTEVRGRSMLPVFRDGDRLFHRFLSGDPTLLIGEVVVARIKDGRRFVKVLQPGSKRGRFTLESINPLYAPMEDQPLDAVAEIIWVKRRPKNRK
ncbi:MAG: S24 family peptidase [Reyranella sp.]|uniref:S24 family peptidase n=1 Tax=Reyranella sp. TaxID=1929291 RepID=UPI0025F83C67|nr:S24 family peptidase [Reyranella sp.]MBR2819814.1 S24 family peptidase [Reyranella sp.]